MLLFIEVRHFENKDVCIHPTGATTGLPVVALVLVLARRAGHHYFDGDKTWVDFPSGHWRTCHVKHRLSDTNTIFTLKDNNLSADKNLMLFANSDIFYWVILSNISSDHLLLYFSYDGYMKLLWNYYEWKYKLFLGMELSRPGLFDYPGNRLGAHQQDISPPDTKRQCIWCRAFLWRQSIIVLKEQINKMLRRKEFWNFPYTFVQIILDIDEYYSYAMIDEPEIKW